MHEITKRLIRTFQANQFHGTTIFHINQSNSSIQVSLQLPPNKEKVDLLDLLPNIQQELKATDHRIKNESGKRFTIEFGSNNLNHIQFTEDYIMKDTLKIKLPSSFGNSYLDFADGASCHLLNGGTTRMGKTVFLLYTATMLYIQTKGEIDLHITSTKLKDYYPFNGLPNVKMSRTEEELLILLDDLILEYKKRDVYLYSDILKSATDAKSVKEIYPDLYYLFRPSFLIIDEYARFSANKDIQSRIMELVESAGYVNIHVIISTQRPDARTVLPPRIKANLLARICFTTADKNNSLIILDREGAETLGKIKGRAYFLDSDMTMVQVPYLDTSTCEELLKPYKKETKQDDKHDNEEETGLTDIGDTNEIQNHDEESNSHPDFQFEHELSQCDKPSHETPINGWFRLAGSENKG
jgi:hypothetical protein